MIIAVMFVTADH